MSKPQQLPADFKKFGNRFPTKDNCDPDNPYEAFLWCLVALPYQTGGGAMVLPAEYLQLVSKRLWDLGCRPTGEPTLRYEFPSSGDAHWLANPGTWVPANSPRKVFKRPVEAAVDGLLNQQASELVEELYSRMSPVERQTMDVRVKEVTAERVAREAEDEEGA